MTTTNDSSSTTSLLALKEFLLCALKLKVHCDAVKNDLHYTRNQGKILYLVDGNIFNMFTQPIEAHCGIIFPDDNRDDGAILSLTLAQHIFFSIDTNGSKVGIFPQHGVETVDYWTSLNLKTKSKSKSDIEDQKSRKDVISFITKAIKESDSKARKDLLVSHQKKIGDFLRSENSPHREFERLNRLLNLRCVIPFETLLHSSGLNKDELEAINSALHSDKWIYNFHKNKILGLLSKKKYRSNRSNRSVRGLEYDTDVLSTLYLINKTLLEKGFIVKCVLITADSRLIEAAQNLPTPCLNPESSKETFHDFCVRDPIGYLALPQLLKPTSEQTNNTDSNPITDWLDGLVSWFSTRPPRMVIADIASGKYDDFIERIDRTESGFYIEAKRRWQDYKDILIQGHTSSTPNFRQFLEIMFGTQLPSEGESKLAEVDLLALPEREKNLVALEQAMMLSGFQLFEESNFCARNPPPLKYGRYCHANELFDWLVQGRNQTDQSHSVATYNIKRLLIEKEEDDTGYAVYTVLAMVFAVLGKWDLVSNIANRAIQIASSDRGNKISKVSGREAYYLKAVSTRHNAKNDNDFAEAEVAIIKASELLKDDNASREPDEKDITTLRFEAESSSIKLARLLRKYIFSDSYDNAETDLQSLTKLFECFQEYKERIMEETDKRTKEYLFEKGFVSTFMIAFLCEYTFKNSLDFKLLQDELNFYKEKISKFDLYENNNEKQTGTSLFWNLHHFCLLRYDQSNLKGTTINRIRHDVHLLSNKKNNAQYVSSYDPKREKWINEVTLRLANEYIGV